ncbi:MAG: hypothetical protein HKN15_04355 [Xanthomonadales bacterium]|nr:hypothetical protein [Xanthomonadales bacterium]
MMELMITLAISSIALGMAVPSWQAMQEKRVVVTAAQGVASMFQYAQSESVKRNERISVNWFSPGGHGDTWCVGLSSAPQNMPCDCRETDSTKAEFCAVNGIEQRLLQDEVAPDGSELMHMRPTTSSFAFEPTRGLMTDIPTGDRTEILDGDWLFYLHSDTGSGQTRNFELQFRIGLAGKVSLCTDIDRRGLISSYPEC